MRTCSSQFGTRAKRNAGLTIVEMMVVVIVIGILLAVAIPVYKEHTIKARRTEGKAALLQVMQQQERHYSVHARYAIFHSNMNASDISPFRWHSGETPETSAYEIHAQPCSGKSLHECIKLTARPGTARVDARFSDARCGELGLTSDGQRFAARESCW
ncbi:type IV pilin protein [uncultured Oxalicibacterium sp.]|uniref:type IV pilin protein n=1 Tax=uncultured Oxalicibacterium sp. TaxID=1168540 RepID=UPI0025FC782B|nr:type IV pilin protein [uncultured Oxalicibacterium sp.]